MLTPPDIYLFKINSENIRTKYKVCLKLTIKTPERRHWSHSSAFNIKFEQISQTQAGLILVSPNTALIQGSALSILTFWRNGLYLCYVIGITWLKPLNSQTDRIYDIYVASGNFHKEELLQTILLIFHIQNQSDG